MKILAIRGRNLASLEGDFEIDDKEEEIFKALVSDSSEFFNNKVADAIREQLK